MRLFFFNNMMLSDKQHGIQAGHAAVRLLRKYLGRLNPEASVTQSKLVEDWADNHETFIILNAGTTDNQYAIRRHLESKHNPFPWVYFKEPNIKAKGEPVMTSIAVLLPASFYEVPTGYAEYNARPANETPAETWAREFLTMKNRCALA